MYGIFVTGGKQYRVTEGQELFVEKLENEVGSSIEFTEVLAVGSDASFQVGTPTVAGAKVVAEVVKHGKQKKVIVFKYKAKKGYRRKNGHRQPYTCLKITSITA